MTIISDLPCDLVEEILSRVPIKSLRAVRSTCKRWSVLFKDESFAKKHYGKSELYRAIPVMTMYDFRPYLTSLDLHKIHSYQDASYGLYINPIGKLDQVHVSKIFHCDGLLLCVFRDDTRLLVWNPYLGQTRWLKPRKYFHILERYALGYDKNNNRHKILTFLDRYDHDQSDYSHQVVEYEIYDLKSDSRRVYDVIPDWYILHYRQGLTLKGNTYFVAHEILSKADEKVEIGEFLLCFDFTRERFGPRLHLPFHSRAGDSVILSTVGEEKLAVLCRRRKSSEMEIWITTKVEASAVFWREFLKVEMIPYIGRFQFLYASFFVDEKKKLALICDKDVRKSSNYTAYMVGEDRYYREVNLGASKCLPLACSYVPSSVQIQQGLRARGKRKQRGYH